MTSTMLQNASGSLKQGHWKIIIEGNRIQLDTPFVGTLFVITFCISLAFGLQTRLLKETWYSSPEKDSALF